MRHSIIKNRYLRLFLIALFWIGIWQILSMTINQQIIIPSPISILKILIEMISIGEFYMIVLISLLRVILGFIIGAALGIIFAILAFKSRIFKDFLSPIIGIIRATPVVTFALIVMLFIKANYVAIVISLLAIFPLFYQNVLTGISGADKKLLEMANVFHFPILKKVKYIYIDAVRPYINAAVLSGVGFAFKAGISGEVLSIPKTSIGLNMYLAKIYLNTDRLFAWTVVVIILSLGMTWITKKLINHINKKERSLGD